MEGVTRTINELRIMGAADALKELKAGEDSLMRKEASAALSGLNKDVLALELDRLLLKK